MTGFLDVILRGLALVAQSIAIGGVVFALLLLRSAAEGDVDSPPVSRTLRLAALAAAALALIQVTLITVLLVALSGGDDPWPLGMVLQTGYGRAAILRIAASLVFVALAWIAARGPRPSRGLTLALALPAVALALNAAFMSHAAARMDGRGAALALNVVHQLAAGVWIGGLFHLLAIAVRRDGRAWPAALLERFSTVALVAVAVLVGAGLVLLRTYVDGLQAFTGTSYGLMVQTKLVILGGLLALGALNFFAIRRARRAGRAGHVRCFVEVELGLGATALFVAASLTSLPVAADVVDRATAAEVVTRFTPRMPTLTSPPIEALPVDDRNAPRTDADRAWSEFNHHVAGLFVLFMGILAIVSATGRARWARHWPLTFLGLAAFLLVRNDPGAWPLGPEGFWESMRHPEVLQHRTFVALVVVFGIFEWMVRTGRLRAPRCALVFPLLCAIGGALLLTHSHAASDLKNEFLTEITHAPLGLLGIAVGWGRWLELRLPPGPARVPAHVWAWSFALVGMLLLIYRES